MFLHSGTGMHKHEYSPTLDTRRNSVPRRTALSRAAFSTPLPSRKSTTYEIPTPIASRSGPRRPLSEIIQRSNEREPVVRFQDPELDTMSEDGGSVANSDVSGTTSGGGRRRRRSTRSSTSYSIAHPAPTLTQKQRLLHIRPKLLLQLQRLSTDSRPRPSLDVLPSTLVVPRLTKKFPRMFKGKAELGRHDVMVIRSEEYDTIEDHASEESDSDEEGLGNRELVAVICQARKDLGGSQGKAEIVLSDGSVWMATPLLNGTYEFTTTDERGDKTTARWVKRSSKQKSTDAAEPGTTCEVKFTFSLIDPNTRRHPILASLTQSKLEIPDFYTSVSSSAGKHPPTSPRAFPGEPERSPIEEERPSERTTHTIDENVKTLIQITSVWVALRQGWSPYFKYNDAMATPTAVQQTTPGGRVRSTSLVTADVTRPSPAPTTSSTPESNHSTFGLGGRIRRSSCRGSPATGDSPQQERVTVPTRAVSAGTAFMQRAAARRAGNPPSTVQSDSEGESMMGLPTRATTDHINGSITNVSAPPGSLTLPGSLNTTPDNTPTKPQRRTQSAYIPTSSLQNGFTYEQPARNSFSDGMTTPDSIAKPVKLGRWKTFTNIFRRMNSSSRSRG